MKKRRVKGKSKYRDKVKVWEGATECGRALGVTYDVVRYHIKTKTSLNGYYLSYVKE